MRTARPETTVIVLFPRRVHDVDTASGGWAESYCLQRLKLITITGTSGRIRYVGIIFSAQKPQGVSEKYPLVNQVLLQLALDIARFLIASHKLTPSKQ